MAVKHTCFSKDGTETISLTPNRAIRKKCLECSSWSYTEVVHCQIDKCALFPFRLGKNPGSTRKGNAEALQRARNKKQAVN